VESAYVELKLNECKPLLMGIIQLTNSGRGRFHPKKQHGRERCIIVIRILATASLV